LLQKEFDEDDIANDKYNTDFSTDSNSDTDSYDSDNSSDSDDSPPTKPSRKSKKKVKLSTKKVTTAPIVDASAPSSIEILAKQVQELQLGQTRQIQELQQGQVNILRELAAGRATGGSIAVPERRCFICDKPNAHRLGIYNCPEVRVLIEEGLVAYSPDGRLMRANGGVLPRGIPNGGVAKALRDEKLTTAASSSDLKGKGREGRDPPPHMAAIAGLQSYGRDVLDDDTYGVYSFPTTRSQAKDAKKGNANDRKLDSDSRAPTAGVPKPQAPAPQRQIPPVRQQPVNVPSNTQPHPANTEDTWRQRKTVPKPNLTSQPPGRNNAEVQDPNKLTKPSSGYHFTSTIQEMVDGDAIQRKILDTMITLPLKEILGISPELQKRFAGLTKTRREYTSKPVVATSLDDPTHADSTIHDNEDTLDGTRDPFSNSELLLSYDEDTENVDDILLRYSSAVKIHTNPLFAMTTGRFEGTIATRHVVFMIDTGSELNLISDELYRQTSLALDVDGARWSLKGINGGAVPLVGCCRDVPLLCGGHRFDHHFFVSREGTGKQDVILGQPWLQWYSASLMYSRTGIVEMCVWKDGDRERGSPPTLSIQLVTANAPRNTDKLTFHGQRSRITDASNSEN
jgi:hypothetical protein